MLLYYRFIGTKKSSFLQIDAKVFQDYAMKQLHAYLCQLEGLDVQLHLFPQGEAKQHDTYLNIMLPTQPSQNL